MKFIKHVDAQKVQFYLIVLERIYFTEMINSENCLTVMIIAIFATEYQCIA